MTLWKSKRNTVQPILAMSIAVLVWAFASAGWLDHTIVSKLDQGLRDFYLTISVDGRADNAPGLLHLTFDNEALSRQGLPTRVPLSALQDMLDVARSSQQTIILDVDLATRSDIGDVDRLLIYLNGWSEDAAAPLLLLAYPLYEIAYQKMEAYRHLDDAVAASPNIRWAGVGTFADDDGVVRSYEYWSCVDRRGDGVRSVLPSMALYAWARYVSSDVNTALAAVDETMRAAEQHCSDDPSSAATEIFGEDLPHSGIIEYQTSIDATADGGDIRYAPDGLPRLVSVGYCRISPAGCGVAGGATDLAAVAHGRIVMVSAANDFSRDDHATPVGYLSGSVILGNVARALINGGPPRELPAIGQLALVLLVAVLIHVVWAAFDRLRTSLRSGTSWPFASKVLHGILNPAVVQWLAFAAADALVLFYYYHWFGTSDWAGLVGASFGATTVAAIAAFNEWWSTPWEKQRTEEGT
jgi:hypothetical protein